MTGWLLLDVVLLVVFAAALVCVAVIRIAQVRRRRALLAQVQDSYEQAARDFSNALTLQALMGSRRYPTADPMLTELRLGLSVTPSASLVVTDLAP